MSVLEKLAQAHNDGEKLSVHERLNGSLQEAYQYQKQLVEQESKKGNHLKGYKISLTSKKTQELFGATSPLYGALTEDSIVEGEILLSNLSEPLIEVELMFLIDEKIEPTDDEETIIRKSRIAPGIEVPDSRYEDWFPNLSLTQIVADRAVAGKIIVGEPMPLNNVRELNSITATVMHNKNLIATGQSSDVLGNPVHAVKWLVDELAQTGQYLQRGMIISSGTFMMPQKLEKGHYDVDFEGVGKTELTVK